MNSSKELEIELKKKFLCPDKFAQQIESRVKENPNINYITAIVEYCEENNIDLESVSKLITKPLKEKLRFDATELNFLKKTSTAKLIL